MKVFVIGGSGNGKSAFAEKVAAKFGGKMIYIATMPIYSEEDLKVVERHHKLRAGRGFETLERSQRIEDYPDQGETVLLEDMSTHVANVMFGDGFDDLRNDPNINYEEVVWKEICPFFEREGNTIIVSAEVTMDGNTYDPATNQYIRTLAEINNRIAASADLFVEVIYGIPLVHKGSLAFLEE
ncbi:MAG: bifunctional adenosylcobinamide kinase/adenosylcobinamide-phosphate guanylyltransferase [Lachnospiraceae bacterium]|nr:bifunctional adenosylcobinamide kinase/adenosylcobinamide-phosphate guanylyltransferase [Lachnospiraceae bacterium]